ncbi:nuclear pore complex protein Nup153-like isoform X1 [Branchiostoma floridae]|uniref:Nuclear pore complex protein Nup153 n=1 Tax=Branchiostoma floridae TaxID=7739 RepID=A0A9J7HUX4_BRAFL|nr:nuclear pore complex protein Nup153-like isoform X1 [Branchiostoma floridae]
MATSGAGKARSRRSHAPKPYARSGGRKSILSSVTEYLTPSWLKGMWRQDESGAQPTTLTERPNTRGKPAHVPVVHVREDQNGLDEEEEEEETEVPPVRVTKNRLTHHQDPSVQGSDDARHGPGYFSQIPLTRGSIHAQRPQSLPATSSYTTTYTREAPSNPGLHAAEEDKFSEDSASTSVSFSNVPQVDQSERRSETTTEEVVRDIARPKSLWSEERETRMSVPQQPARSARRPAFNYSVFGSPALNDSSSLFGSPITESPFYEGRTTYGGASAQKHGQKRGRTVSPLQVAPHTMRQQVRPKPASSSRGSGVMSVTAQRILHTLERMSTPISDAKRIPSLTLSTDESPLGFTPSTKKRRVMGGSFLEPGTSRLEGRLAGQPPVQRLNLSTPASIATNRAQTHSTYRPRKSAVLAKEEILVPDSEPATSVARDREPSPLKVISKPASKPAESRPAPVTKPSSQAASTWTPPAQLPIGSGGKIRRERSYGTQRAHAVQDEEEVEVPVLPEIALPIASLPKFDFSPAPSKPLSEGSKVSTTPQVSSVTSSPQFTFASPIVMSSPEDSTPAVSNTETPKFQFSQPASPGKSFPSQGLGTSSAVSAGSSTFLTTGAGSGFQPKRKAPEPVVSPSAAASPPPLKQGSVLDALKAEPLPLKSGSVLDALKGGPLVSKPETTKEKLEERKTTGEGSAAANTKTASLPSLGDQFKKPSGGWDCDTCMVQNTAAASRCVACDTPKPGSQPKLTVPTTVPPVSFGTDAAPKTNGFKLGTTAEGGSANSGFKFGSGSAVNSTSSGFTFGSSSASTAASEQDSNTLGGLKKGTTDFVSTNANTQDASKSIWSKAASGNKWTCDTCLVENKNESTKCAACESPKPGSESKTAASTPAVNFGTSSAFKSTSSSSGSLLAAANNGQKWECQTCLVYNTDDKTKCAACETPKPGSQNKSTPAVGASGSGGFSLGTNSSGLAAAISAQQSKWECETCMVQNDKDATKCLACETPKPGSAQSSSGTGGFQFGSQSTSTGKTASFGSSTGGFQFGAPKPASTETATDSKPTFSGFKFGSGGAESAPSTATSGGLQFGAGTTAASTTPSGGLSFGAGTTTASTGGFTFGAASSASGAATTTSNATSSASGGFTFGTGTTSGAAASVPAATGGFTFGTGSSAAGAAASAGFKFGAGTASQQPDAAPKMTSIADLAKAGQLSVPKPAAGQSTAKRSLESDNSTPAKVNLSSAFGSGTPFGSANPSTAPSFGSTTGANPPVFGAGTSAAPSSGLTFGAPAAAASATGSAAATTSGFTFGTGSSSTAASTTPAPFSFGAGAPPAATTAATASAPFVFGGGASSAPGGSTGGFNFSGGQTAPPATTTAPSFGTPAFGANPTPAASTPFAPATTAVSGGATPFGGATSFGVQTTSAPSSGPVFGASAAQPAPTAGFNFNAPSQPTFQFGAGSQQSPAVFNFGAAAPAAAAPGGGFNFAAGAGTAAPAPQPAAPFNFSAGAQPGGNPFSIQSTPSASPGGRRVIKKAQRRKR